MIRIWAARSLHGRLLRRLLLGTTVVVGISSLLTYGLARHFSDRVFDAWLSDTALSLADVVAGGADLHDAELINAIEQQTRFDTTDVVSFMVRGPQGLIAGRADLPVPQTASSQPREAQLYDARIDDRAVRIARVELHSKNNQSFTVAVAETVLKRRIVASELLVAALIPALLLALVAAALIGSGVQRALSPLDSISAALAQRDPLDLTPLADGELSEIQPLIHAVNDLLARLKLALDAQRNFVADTAHQLRNPLAGLKLQIEEGLRRTDSFNHDRLRSLLGGVERASRLATQLLALARAEADATQAATPIEVFDLEQLAAERGRDWAPRLLRQNLQIQLEAPPTPVYARGRPLLLGEALDNLLDNALRYAGRGAHLTLHIERVADEAWLTVSDDGPGFAPGMEDALFRRFARGDHASGDGAGLGLAIVRELLRAQQGDAEAVSVIGSRGAAIRLRLRAA